MRKVLSESGQAVIEYVLMLALVVSLIAIMSNSLRRSLFGLWQSLAREIAAACPDCPADPKIRF